MVKATQKEQQAFKKIQKKYVPPRPWFRNAVLAFLVGGAISAVGEGIRRAYMSLGLGPDLAAGPLAATMVFLGALLTGLGVYDEIGRIGGMGAALPITGFANSIVSPAMEFKREGWVMGVGAKMFVVAGPVVVFGLVTSLIVGLGYYLLYHPR